ncbi:protein SFI1 homolog isoform X2 [Corticium candelabrum]|uniref:protein SFI1 homolog isoform X2 n=1 Tax=Corticium candelabrum TaxID=121492 RepID=UPI002E318401|nr:protein SFI1 homolog isoform X2 [Corticium candelabrum]
MNSSRVRGGLKDTRENTSWKKEFMKSRIPRPLRLTSKQQQTTLSRAKHVEVEVGQDQLKITNLRERVLARKYVALWQTVTFGSSRFQKARKFCEKNCVKHALAQWIDLWWTSRREWKLMIKADCHVRYELWRKMWDGWRRHTELSKKSSTLKQQADHHACIVLTRMALSGWLSYWKIQKIKSSLYQTASDVCNGNVLRNMFGKWKAEKQLVCQRNAQRALAAHLQCRNGIAQTWKRWTEEYQCRQSARERMDKLLKFAYQKLVWRLWQCWRLYIDGQRICHNRKGLAHQFRKTQLLHCCWSLWVTKKIEAQTQKRLQQQMTWLGRKFCQRLALEKWKHYVTRCRSVAKLRDDVERFRRKCLLRQVWSCFVKNTIRQQVERRRVRAAQNAYSHLCVRSALRTWLRRCEIREETKAGSTLHIARNHWKNKVLKKCLADWKMYVTLSKEQALKLSSAHSTYVARTLPRYFHAWRFYIDKQHVEQECVEIAVDFRRRTLLAQGFYGWLTAARLILDVGVLQRLALLQQEAVLKRRWFSEWQRKTAEHRKAAMSDMLSEKFLEQKRMRDVFRHWQLYLERKTGRRRLSVLALKHRERCLLSPVWVVWKKYVCSQRTKNSVTRLALNHYETVIKEKALAEWKDYCHQCAQDVAKWELAVRLDSNLVVRCAFKRWYTNVCFIHRLKSMQSAAERLRGEAVVRCTWRAWTTRTTVSQETRSQAECLLNSYLRESQMSLVNRTYRKWHQKTSNRFACKKAASHLEKTLLRRMFSSWLLSRQLCSRNKLYVCMADDTRCQQLQASLLSLWKRQLQDRKSWHHKERTALWYWSQQLQRKVIHTWLDYAASQQHFQERIQCALSLRRDHFIKRAVVCWIKFATTRQAERKSINLKRQIESAQSAVMYAHHCGQRWLQATRSKSGRRKESTLAGNQLSGLPTDAHAYTEPATLSFSKRRPPRSSRGSLWARPEALETNELYPDVRGHQSEIIQHLPSTRTIVETTVSESDFPVVSDAPVALPSTCSAFQHPAASASSTDQDCGMSTFVFPVIGEKNRAAARRHDGYDVNALLQLKHDLKCYHEEKEKMRELAAVVEELRAKEHLSESENKRLQKANQDLLTLAAVQEKKLPVVLKMTDLVTKLTTATVIDNSCL